MKIGEKVIFKTSKKSIQMYYGKIIDFMFDKIKITKYKYKDYSGIGVTTWIEKCDLIHLLN